MTRDTCGPMSGKPLAFFDPDTSSWRMYETTLTSDSTLFSGKLPNWGTTVDGVLSGLPTLAPHISGQDSSSLPTPTARDWKEQGPTFYYRDGVLQEDLLPRAIWAMQPELNPKLLPTPTVVDMGNNKTPDEWEEWKAKQKAVHQNGNGHGASLTQEALTLLPTPSASDSTGAEPPSQRQGRSAGGPSLRDLPYLLPSIGESTLPLSAAGNPSSDGQHPHLLF